jgi:hypothetical protein
MDKQLLPRRRKDERVAPRSPMRTFAELCEEFGLTLGQLRKALSDPDAPKGVRHGAHRAGTETTWYDAAAARRWWSVYKTQRRFTIKEKKG